MTSLFLGTRFFHKDPLQLCDAPGEAPTDAMRATAKDDPQAGRIKAQALASSPSFTLLLCIPTIQYLTRGTIVARICSRDPGARIL